MNDADLTGWVVVVAGDEPRLSEVSGAAMTCGAAVAVVSAGLDDDVPAAVRFRADPRDPDAWERIAMHVEQHLGPIDGVVTDASTRAAVHDVFDADLRRRHRAAVIVVEPATDVDAVLTALTDMPRSATSPHAAAAPDP